MKKYIISIICFILGATAVAQNDNWGDVRVAGKDFYKSGMDFLKTLDPEKNGFSESWKSTKADVTEVITLQEYKKQYEESMTLFKDLKEQLKSNASQSDIKAKCKEISSKISGLKDHFEDYYKDKGDDNALVQMKNTSFKKFDEFEANTKNLIDKATTLYEDGVSFSMPVGFEQEFGNIYVKLLLTNMKFVRSNGGKDGSTKAKAEAYVALPFLPKQHDGSSQIAFGGDVVFKSSDENQTSRIWLERDLRIPVIRDKVDLILFGKNTTDRPDKNRCYDDNGSNGDAVDEHISYIEFNCNEVTDVNLIGFFDFSGSKEGEKPNFLIAMDGENEAPDKHVIAPFSARGKGGVSSKLCFSHPFKVKGLGDFIFDVKNAVADFSDIQNALDFQTPDYWTSPLAPEAWMGFYLQQMEVTFPKEFFLNKKNTTSTSVEVKNMYIDDYGFSGEAYIHNLMDIDFGNGGTNVQLDEISAKFQQDEFVGGKLSGSASFPFLAKFDGGSPENEKKNIEEIAATQSLSNDAENKKLEEIDSKKNILKLGFSADVIYTNKPQSDAESEPEKYYAFNAKIELKNDQKYKVPFTSVAYMTLKKGASLTLTNNKKTISTAVSEAGESEESEPNLLFTFTMNGELGVSTPLAMSKGSSKNGFDLSFSNIPFEGLKFCNVGNPVDIEHIALNGEVGARLLGFSIGISRLEYRKNKLSNSGGSITIDGTDKKWKAWTGSLCMDARVGLVSGSSGFGAGVTSIFKFATKSYDNAAELSDKLKWNYTGFNIGRVSLNADFSAFRLSGYLDIFKDDETFGKGFRGSIDLSINPIGLGIGAQVCFGTTQGEKPFDYWFTRATAEMASTHILLFPPAVFLNSVTGGAYSKMNIDKKPTIKGLAFAVSDVSNYKPDPNIGFGFIAGIGVYIGSENLAKAKAELEMTFAKSLALDQIRIGGEFSVIAPKSSKFKISGFKDKIDKLKSKVSEDGILTDLGAFNELTKTDENVVMTNSSGTISGWVNMQFVRQTKQFLMNSALYADLWGVITGAAYFDFFSEPGFWQLSLGTYDKPNKLKFLKFATARSYFELGHLSRSFYPPLSKEAAKQFGYNGGDYSSVMESTKAGKGFAFGLDMLAELDIELLKVAYLSVWINGGADAMVSNRKYEYDGKCHSWRAHGDIYGSIGVKFGAVVPIVDEKIKIFHGSAFLGLMGELPSPVHGKGVVKFNATFGEGWFDVNKEYKCSLGKTVGECGLDKLKDEYDD